MVETEIMRRVNKFDNMLDNSVMAFNKLFNCRLPFNLEDEVEILEPFTCGGRYIKVGDREPFRHIFRKDFSGYELKHKWKAVYRKGNMLGIFKTSRDFESYSGINVDVCYNILNREYKKSGNYLVLELFE